MEKPLQEELGDWQTNPDVPSIRLYRCWDSSALISEDKQSKGFTVQQEGGVSASQAASLMWLS